jgi:methyl-accepting chemotaxis protein
MRFTIKAKLAIAFSLVILLTGVMAAMAITNLSSLNTAITDIIQGPAANLRNSSDLSDAVLYSIRAEKNAILNTDPSKIQGYVTEVKDRREAIDRLLKNLDKEQNPNIRAKISEFRSLLAEWYPLQDRVIALAEENTTESNARAGEISMGEGAANNAKLLATLTGLNEEIAADLKQTDEATNLQYDNSRNLLIGIVSFVLIFSLAVAVWIGMGVNSGLKKIRAAADAVAIGDLDQEIETKTNDEIKDVVDTINVMTANLRNTAQIANQIANGDLTVTPKALSDKDTYVGLVAGKHGGTPARRRRRCDCGLRQRLLGQPGIVGLV